MKREKLSLRIDYRIDGERWALFWSDVMGEDESLWFKGVDSKHSARVDKALAMKVLSAIEGLEPNLERTGIEVLSCPCPEETGEWFSETTGGWEKDGWDWRSLHMRTVGDHIWQVTEKYPAAFLFYYTEVIAENQSVCDEIFRAYARTCAERTGDAPGFDLDMFLWLTGGDNVDVRF